jgi:hypothetical protein
MSNVQSYNALIDRFHAFASGHFILKRFSHGQIEVSDLEKFGEYPFMHVVPSNVTYAKGMKTFSFQIVLADLPRDKEDKPEYQREVLSDLQRIAEDLVAEITNHRMLFGDLITVQNVSLEPFLEEFQHTLTGWTISLDLLVPYYWDACSIPAEWNDFFESGSGGTGSILTFIDSINRDENGNVSLVNDEETPAPNYYYGTNGAGVRGWYLTTDNIGLTCETIGDCQTIIDIEAAIDALEEEIILKADISSISAVGFSNDYNDLDNLPTLPTGTVTSIDLTAGTGISVSGGPITSSGSITVTNSAPDQVVALSAGTGISTSGTYPNFTITNSAPSSGGTVTSVAALTLGTTGTDLSSTVATGTTTPVITLNVPTASAANRGALSSADWNTFNGKFTLPSLTSGSVLFSNGTTIAQDNANLFWDDTNNRLGIGTATPSTSLDVNGIIRTPQLSFGGFDSGKNLLLTYSSGPNFRIFTTAGQYAIFGCGGLSVGLTSAAISPPTSGATIQGNVLIGTTTDAGYKLDVNGTARVSGTTTITPATLTGSSATSSLDIAQTWNTTGTPIALKVNITDTASAALSDLISLQVGGSARFRVLKSGYFVHNTGGEIQGSLVVGSASINASAVLQSDSVTKGFLPPRMTTTQKNAIASPAAGLVVYDTTLNKLCVRTASAWETITSV